VPNNFLLISAFFLDGLAHAAEELWAALSARPRRVFRRGAADDPAGRGFCDCGRRGLRGGLQALRYPAMLRASFPNPPLSG